MLWSGLPGDKGDLGLRLPNSLSPDVVATLVCVHQMFLSACTWTHTTHTHTPIRTLMHTHTHTHSHAHSHFSHTFTLTCTHHTCTHSHPHRNVHTPTPPHPLMCACTQSPPHVHMCMRRMHTHTRAPMLSHTHWHTCAHTAHESCLLHPCSLASPAGRDPTVQISPEPPLVGGCGSWALPEPSVQPGNENEQFLPGLRAPGADRDQGGAF